MPKNKLLYLFFFTFCACKPIIIYRLPPEYVIIIDRRATGHDISVDHFVRDYYFKCCCSAIIDVRHIPFTITGVAVRCKPYLCWYFFASFLHRFFYSRKFRFYRCNGIPCRICEIPLTDIRQGLAMFFYLYYSCWVCSILSIIIFY